jgi:hypothetical protein
VAVRPPCNSVLARRDSADILVIKLQEMNTFDSSLAWMPFVVVTPSFKNVQRSYTITFQVSFWSHECVAMGVIVDVRLAHRLACVLARHQGCSIRAPQQPLRDRSNREENQPRDAEQQDGY